MLTPPKPKNEKERLAALRKTGILDTPSEARFDRIIEFAGQQFGVPIALVSLLDENRQWFKAACGLDVNETARDVAFCAYTILGDQPLVVFNAQQDPRFANNPLVTGEPGIRFYAGVPLRDAEGFCLGTLCLVDTAPRNEFSATDQALLVSLAAVVADYVNAGDTEEKLTAAIDRIGTVEQALTNRDLTLQAFFQSLPIPAAMLNVRLELETASPAWFSLFGGSAPASLGMPIDRAVPDIAPEWRDQNEKALSGSTTESGEECYQSDGLGERWLIRRISPWRQVNGEIGGLIVVIEDITYVRRASSALCDSEAFLKAVLDHVHDGIVACDADGQLSHFNRATRTFHGLESESLPPEQWAERYDLFQTDGVTRLPMESIPLWRAFNGEPIENEEIVIAPNGKPRRRVVCNGSQMANDKGEITGAVVSMHDVTDEHAANRRFDDANLRYRAILDQTFQFFAILDAEGIVMEANATALDFAGLSTADVAGQLFDEARWWGDDPAILRRLQLALKRARAGQFVRYETEVQDRYGEPVPIDFSLKPVKNEDGSVYLIIAEGRDISEIKGNEHKLRESENRYRNLYNKTPTMLFSFDRHARIITVSDYWLETMGYRRFEILDRCALDFMAESSAQIFEDAVLPSLFSIGKCERTPLRFHHSDGEAIPVFFSAVGERDEDEQVQRAIAVLLDAREASEALPRVAAAQ